jgi:hypothetical protein
MFSSHATPQRIYIMVDKLHLNKLSHVSIHVSGVTLLSPQRGGFHFHMANAPHGTTPLQQVGTMGGVG